MSAAKRQKKRAAGAVIRGRIGEDSYNSYTDADVDTPWLTLEQVGAYVHVGSHVTVRRLIREEGLPVVKVGRRYLSRAAWLDEWLRRRAEEQREEGA